MDLLSTLNERQREAVLATEGPLLILAGAGSGKTRVITVRIAYLISERHVPPHNILAVTFTNKAAQEMRERVTRLLGGQKLESAPLVSTFHSLCVRMLRRDIEKLEEGYTRAFTIYDQDDSVRVVKSCVKDLGYDDQRLGARQVQSAISHAKNSGLDADSFAARVESHDEKRAAIARVFRLYEERLVNNNALDFDDLLIKAVRLLRKREDVRAHYNERFRYILVDEYQDTNALQFALINFLTQKQQNICVVGDDSQSIYGWRGADITNILSFEQHYPNAKIIRLEQNYRSTQNILNAADAVIKHNVARKDKTLWTANPAGSPIRYYQALDAETEARFVAAKIEEHRRADPKTRAAILYRTNAQSRLFEEAMRRAGIPYNIVGGFSFYERAEVRDIVSYLKLALNPHDSVALLRVVNTPPRGLGKQTLDELDRRAKDYGVSLWETIGIVTNDPAGFNPRAVAALKKFQAVVAGLVERAQKESASEVVKAAILDTGYADALKAENTEEAEGRLENLQELVNAAVDYDAEEGAGLRDFIDAAALVSDTDQYRGDAPVTLMTMHSAKGLEFPVVFIVGMEDGLFPHSRSATDPQELEEERRLAYVAITRAEKFLYVSHAMRRRVYGEELASEPSQFLNEMPLELMEDLSRGASWLSFARSSSAMESRQVARALRGEAQKPQRSYGGKTYDSVDSIAEFFRQRGDQINRNAAAAKQSQRPGSQNQPPNTQRQTSPARPSTPSRGSGASSSASSDAGFTPGMHVKHPKYGRGLVLRREGVGDSAKLLVSFPGFGQKKLVEKYAGLEKA
ncbi:MAG TPA: UvrD-helicase domain-containing protein [Pyrinomonadaceae bacterium]|jgi:DNA helicase-2/ATP-dependent DNA helicase PcrA|nr:UvrD-helicase domain-containing protein [Pyrinomonadaceae bacterium]